MTLEDQVCSLELSKKLKELGVKQDAFWSWYDTVDYDDIPRINRSDEHCPVCTMPQQSFEEKYSALTVAEFGKILYRCPEDILLRAYGHIFNVQDTHIITPKGLQILLISPNLLAKMLIYLLENNLITL